MSGTSTLDPDNTPAVGNDEGTATGKGHGIGSLGASDLSDTGSDTIGARGNSDEVLESDTDSGHTGEDVAADGTEPEPVDRGYDRVVGRDEAGLGSGLDEAEEARLGLTDEDLFGTQSDLPQTGPAPTAGEPKRTTAEAKPATAGTKRAKSDAGRVRSAPARRSR